MSFMLSVTNKSKMLSVDMLSVIMLSVTNKSITLNVIMLSVLMLNVVAPKSFIGQAVVFFFLLGLVNI
jgi:hypothetical protein